MKYDFNAYAGGVFFVLLFFIGISYSYGNFDKSFECLKFTMADSVRNVGEAVLTDSIYWQHDSLIGDYLKYEYVEIKEFSKRNKLLRFLYDIVFRHTDSKMEVLTSVNSQERFEYYKNKFIRKIDVRILPPYGNGVIDYNAPIKDSLGFLEKIANRIHIPSNENVIKNQLTFKVGDQLRPFELVQNEILLKDLSYVEDALLIPVAVEGNDALVDLLLIVQDEFAWRGTVVSNMTNSLDIEVSNSNFFGRGHHIAYRLSLDRNKDKIWGNRFSYNITNLFIKHITGSFFYKNDFQEKIISVGAERSFISSFIKWGGGIEYNRVYYADRLPDRYSLKVKQLFDYSSWDFWAGHSFMLKPRYSYNQNIYFTGRFLITKFEERPRIKLDSNLLYSNRANYYVSLTYNKLKYYKANFIYDFGRIEDIPTGFSCSATGGGEYNEFKEMGYAGLTGSYSAYEKRSRKFYSFYMGASIYFSSKNTGQGVLKFGFNHFSQLFDVGSCKARFFVNLNYTRGIKRYVDDLIYFRNYDIFGFPAENVKGHKKITGNISSTLFFPFIKRGFRMTMNSFLDIGMIAKENESLLRSTIYSGMGIRLNFRNNNLIIRDISLKFAYYPYLPDKLGQYKFRIMRREESRFLDYRVRKPQAVPYE